jgi:2-dehydro-3-deoxyphosphooctonate aldolase (KDO 8-P synthase)
MNENPLLWIAGPCVMESEEMVWEIASQVKQLAEPRGVSLVFKASFDKANRSSGDSYRGPGLQAGLRLLREIRERLGIRVLSDVHETQQVGPAAEVLDVLQIPAFLCRQTDLIRAAVATGKIVNIKKGQFMSPQAMEQVARKAGAKPEKLWLTERGTTFGYNDLVVDLRGLALMRQWGHSVIFDATHSVQRPGALGKSSGGDRKFIPVLSRAAAAAGIDGLFTEVHPHPEKALSDAATQFPLDQAGALLDQVLAVRAASLQVESRV